MPVTTEALLRRVVDPSPAQAEVCRVLDGRELDGVTPIVTPTYPTAGLGGPPRAAVLLAGVRAGKSLIAACLAVQRALTVDLRGVRRAEDVRLSVVSVDVDRAHAVIEHLHALARDADVSRVVTPTVTGARVRRRDGAVVEVRVEAASRDGGTLVARWQASVIYDEAPRMRGAADGGVVSLRALRRAVAGRLRPGGTELIVGSPAGPRGDVYDLVAAWSGRQTRDLVVIRAPGPLLHPAWWTPERCAEVQRTDPEAYVTDVLGEWGAADEAAFDSALIDVAVSSDPGGEPERVVVAIDPATRGDAWACVVVTEDAAGRVAARCARWWRGTRADPLSPREVLAEVAELAREYGTDVVVTDQHSADALREVGRSVGVAIADRATTRGASVARAAQLRALLGARQISIADARLAEELRAVRRRVSATGEPTIVLPRRGDGHCDGAAALLLALEALGSRAGAGAREAPPPPPPDPVKARLGAQWTRRWDPPLEEDLW